MDQCTRPLNQIKIATPCPANWDQMQGDLRVRFCTHCQLNVYNLSALTQAEATQFITKAEGRLCVRFYQRADGTVITDDCRFGIKFIKQRVSRATSAFLAAIMSLATLTETLWAGPASTHQKKANKPAPAARKPRKSEKRWRAIPTIGVIASVTAPELARPPLSLTITPPSPLPPISEHTDPPPPQKQ